jgi:hypothetical protein
MRYSIGFMFVLVLVAVPLSVSAQADDEGKAAESADTPQPARGVQRWHPEALFDPLAPDRAKFEIEYVPVEPQEATNRRRRRRKIALGVTIPILVVGVVLGIGAGFAVRNMEF